MPDIELMYQRNKLMIKILWILLVFTFIINFSLFIREESPLPPLLVIAAGFPVLLLLNWLIYRRRYEKHTMYLITFAAFLIIFSVNYVDLHPVNLLVLLIPPILSMLYRDWRNILVSCIVSFSIFAFFTIQYGSMYFTSWIIDDILYYLTFYIVLALIMIFEVQMSEDIRMKALKREQKAIEEKNKAEAESKNKIKHMAYHDSLTGLPNRNQFYELLEQTIAHSIQDNTMSAIILLDLDNFKKINDTMGHLFGDQILINAAIRLKESLNDRGMVCRMGGDEFLILVPNVNHQDEIIKVIDQIQEELKHPFLIEDLQIHITTSMGVSFFPLDGNQAEILIKNADIAMYRAKEKGKNTYSFFKPTMNNHTFSDLILENDLRKALDENEFTLHYQPLINLKSNKIVGVEALIRWNHPEKGNIPPSRFIPIAEQTGLIIPIGEWVLRTACQQAQIWNESATDPIIISVNLSLRQFLQQNLVDKIVSILDETRLLPEYLELEITETIAMDIDYTMSILQKLKRLGVKISIDDFGTGYCSLNYLKKLPIDKLKIDKSFVEDILSRSKDAAIVSAIIAIAKNLNLQVVAEGVETHDQLDFLLEKSCDVGQGYLFSKPLPPVYFNNVLESPIVIKSKAVKGLL